MKTKHFLLIFISILVALVLYLFFSLSKLNPKITNIISNLNNISANQLITDTVFEFTDNKGFSKKINFNKEDTLILHFIDYQYLDSLAIYKKNKNDLIFIIDTLLINKENPNYDKVFFFKQKQLPLKFKKLQYPYSLKIQNKKIVEVRIKNIKI